MTLFISSCIRGHFIEGNPIDGSYISLIKPGETSRKEILDWFGPPAEFADPKTVDMILKTLDFTSSPIMDHPFDDAFTYEYTYGKTKALFCSMPGKK